MGDVGRSAKNKRKACKSRALRRPSDLQAFRVDQLTPEVIIAAFSLLLWNNYGKVMSVRGNLLYFRDQVAYSHQIQEMTPQIDHYDWKNKNTDSPPETKSTEQSDENVSRLER